jgi:trimeric autotransporter adhesin
MSTKTTFKRIALVTVAALGFGVLTSVAPATAQVSQSIAAFVGPNGATSLTVVGGDTTTAGALVRIDVTSNETTVPGLALNETVTASVSVAPALRNAGSVVDTTTAVGGTGSAARSDFVVINSGGATANTQPIGTAAATAAEVVSGVTDWTKLGIGATASTNMDSATPTALIGDRTAAARGAIGSLNRFSTRMDGNRTTTTGGTAIASYYVTVAPRAGSDVYDKGAYTFSFQLTDAAGVVRGTTTVKIDFVSSAARSDAAITLNSSGTFLRATALDTYDSTSATYATLTLRNRDGGLVRGWDGRNVAPSATIQWIRTGAATSDTTTLAVNDSGTYGSDFGTQTAFQGAGTLRGQDGVYGLKAAASAMPTLASATGNTYQIWAGYGNATIQTRAITIFAVSGSGTASAANTDVLVTAAGMSTTDQAVKTGATTAFTLPTTTKTATVKFDIETSADTATPGALITVTPTWSTTVGTAQVTPATSTTGTVYTTDSNGNFSVTVTYDAPLNGASLTLVLSGGAAFGAATQTTTLTWATPVVNNITVADPVADISVLTGSTNVTTVLVRDQFGNPMSGHSVTVSVTQSPAVVSTTVITPIVTGATGTATYSFTPAAATTSAVLSFNTAPTAVTAVTHTYTYVATLPVVATLTGYFGRTWGTAATLVPATGIYNAAGSAFVIEDARNISKTGMTDANETNDEISLLFTGLTAAGVSATGASVTVTAGANGHIIGAAGLPVKSRTYAVTASGTAVINVLATGTGAVTFTATSGTVTATASMWVAGRKNTDNSNTAGRFITVTSAKTGAANGSGVPVTVAVTDRYGNPVSGVALNVVASGVGSFMGGSITQSFTTDASGSYTFLANTTLSDGGVAKFTATTGTVGSFDSLAGYVGTTEVDSTLAAGNASASAEITFAAGASATDVAQAATDAAAEATDAANAATDAANAAAEAADAATAAAQDAADAVAALSTQVSEMVNALKKQITALTNLVIKIQKKVRA